MRYWRKGYFETLRSVAKAARTVPEWEDHSAFCEKYENGLRQDAFTILDRFISSYEPEAFEKRRRFVSWLSPLTFGCAGRHMAIPQPLQISIIEPTLLEWMLVDPRSYEPHLWLGGSDHPNSALQLAPENQVVRTKLVHTILSRVGFATHELPAGYLASTHDDLAESGRS